MSERAIFEEIFDGPDSIFGSIFGPSRAKLNSVKREERRQAQEAKAKSQVRIKLTKNHLADLISGKKLMFKTSEGQDISLLVTG